MELAGVWAESRRNRQVRARNRRNCVKNRQSRAWNRRNRMKNRRARACIQWPCSRTM